MKNVEILIVEDCPDCNGDGVVSNPFYDEWEKFRSKTYDDKGRFPTADEHDDWLRSQGFTDWPQEEYECYTCAGSGKWQHTISINELKKLLKDG